MQGRHGGAGRLNGPGPKAEAERWLGRARLEEEMGAAKSPANTTVMAKTLIAMFMRWSSFSGKNGEVKPVTWSSEMAEAGLNAGFA